MGTLAPRYHSTLGLQQPSCRHSFSERKSYFSRTSHDRKDSAPWLSLDLNRGGLPTTSYTSWLRGTQPVDLRVRRLELQLPPWNARSNPPQYRPTSTLRRWMERRPQATIPALFRAPQRLRMRSRPPCPPQEAPGFQGTIHSLGAARTKTTSTLCLP